MKRLNATGYHMNVVVAPDKLHICHQEAALRMSAFWPITSPRG
jgi:hypothetical protein